MRHRGIRVTSLIGRLRLRCYRTGQLSPSWPHVASIGFVVPCGLRVTEVAVLEIRKTDKGLTPNCLTGGVPPKSCAKFVLKTC
jgi:hypothetical protein